MSAGKQAAIHLVEYSPEWPKMFEVEKGNLICLLGGYLEGGIEHIGSTSVQGLIAKPVIDIMFGVVSLDASRGAIELLTRAGYQYSAYKGDIMHWFCKPSFEHRTHHLHLVPFESPLWSERLCFRDRLRSSEVLKQEYSSLKRELARRYQNEREAYTDEKWPFIESELSRDDG